MREPRLSDLDAFAAIMSDAATMRFWSTPPHESRDVTAAWLDRILAGEGARQGHERVVEMDGQVMGKVGSRQLPEIGFILAPAARGRGIAAEAMAALIPFIWGTTGHDHLFADVDPRNAASLRLLARLGFTETHRAENTYCIAGEWSDSVYLRLNRP